MTPMTTSVFELLDVPVSHMCVWLVLSVFVSSSLAAGVCLLASLLSPSVALFGAS